MGGVIVRKPKTLTESVYSNGKTPTHIGVQKHTAFVVEPNGRKVWRFRANTKLVKIDTEVVPSGDMAKDKAMFAQWSLLVSQGINPRLSSPIESATPSFKAIAEEHIETGLGHITNNKNLKQFRSTLEAYAFPYLGQMPVNEIKPKHIYECLKDAWYGNSEKGIRPNQVTASRVLGRIRAVLGRALVLGHIDGPNPAVYPGNLDALLKVTAKKKNFASIGYRDIPKLVAEITGYDTVSALTLLWIAAHVTRTGETLEGTYSQVSADLWSLPFSNTKNRKDFQVPLTDYSLRLLAKVRKHSNGNDFLFPSPTKAHQPISDSSLRNLMAKLDIKGWTKHGMRATFKTWAEEQTNAKNAVIESCLAHVTPGIEKHYMRGEYIDLRRDLMEQWHKHLESAL